MKVCQFCGAESENSANACASCGANKFQYKCENCGTIFEGKRCPNCGVKAGAVIDHAVTESVKKKKIWPWVLGWLLIFPLPLTILMVRKKNIDKKTKMGVIVAAWILYFALAAFGKSSDRADTSKSSMISKSDSMKSDSIHVVVSEPIKVKAVKLTASKSELAIGETLQINASISPTDAEDQKLTWMSSDSHVAAVDEEGNVIAVSGGECTITATAVGGISSSMEMCIDGTKAVMNLHIQEKQENDVNIGNEWRSEFQLNGESVTNNPTLAVGDHLSLYAQMIEEDDKPDVGEASLNHVVTEEDIVNGFEEKMDVYVTENGGKNRGKSAYFVVTFSFSPVK